MNKKKFVLGTGTLLIVVITFFVPNLIPSQQDELLINDYRQADSTLLEIPEPKLLFGFVVDSLIVIEETIRRNQTLSGILSKYNIDHETIHELSTVSKDIFDVRKIIPNKKITFFLKPDSLRTVKAVVYEPSDFEYVVIELGDSLQVEKVVKHVESVMRVASGVIQSSLAETLMELELSPQLTNDFADIFAWQIDFFHLYPEDKFKVIFEEKLVDGIPVANGPIEGAYFQHAGNDYYAIRYDQGNGFDFFDEDGNSLRKALLRYPVKFSRISSRYSGRRYHPVQKTWRAHRGTDFAASAGTPIRTVGDGIILEARYHKFNGNYVTVKHNGNYTTGYLHMIKIARGIKPGVKVKQGQVIGHVGSTGLANGNHVCFRFWKNGVQIDAMKVNLPPSEPILETNITNFNVHRDLIIDKLDLIPYPADEQLLAIIDQEGEKH